MGSVRESLPNKLRICQCSCFCGTTPGGARLTAAVCPPAKVLGPRFSGPDVCPRVLGNGRLKRLGSQHLLGLTASNLHLNKILRLVCNMKVWEVLLKAKEAKDSKPASSTPGNLRMYPRDL